MYIQYSLLVFAFVFPLSADATELGSENYSIITKGFDAVERVATLSSENYSITPDMATNEDTSQLGSKRPKDLLVENTLGEGDTTPFIIGSNREREKVMGGTPFGLKDSVIEENSDTDFSSTDALNVLNSTEKNIEKKQPQEASLIGAWLQSFGKFDDMFATKTARGAVLAVVLVGLFIVRKTAFGKRNLPF